MYRVNDILKIREDAASSFGTQVHDCGRIFCRACMRLKHHIECTHIAERSFALGTVLHIIEMVCTETLLAFLALDNRIGKTRHMAARLPDFRIHQYRSVNAVHIVAVIAKHREPETFNIFLENDPEWAVIVGTGKAAIDL